MKKFSLHPSDMYRIRFIIVIVSFVGAFLSMIM